MDDSWQLILTNTNIQIQVCLSILGHCINRVKQRSSTIGVGPESVFIYYLSAEW